MQATSHYQRFFRPEKMRYERLVNPVSIADGEVGELSGYLDHFPFSKGVSHWIDRHNNYSDFEARQIESEVVPFDLRFSEVTSASGDFTKSSFSIAFRYGRSSSFSGCM